MRPDLGKPVRRRSGYRWVKGTDMPGIVRNEICFDRVVGRRLEANRSGQFEIAFGEDILHLVAKPGLSVFVFDFEL